MDNDLQAQLPMTKSSVVRSIQLTRVANPIFEDVDDLKHESINAKRYSVQCRHHSAFSALNEKATANDCDCVVLQWQFSCSQI